MPVSRSHIASVIVNPALFGVTREYVEAVYGEHGEHLGWEGLGRERIIRELISKGWIRVRDYGNYLTVQVFSLDRYNTAARLLAFFRSVAGRYSSETEVRLGILSQQKTEITTVADLERKMVMTDSRKQVR